MAENKPIKVHELYTFCIATADGEQLHTLISQQLSQAEIVTLDFTSVTMFAAPFFNAAFGPLLVAYCKTELFWRLKFVGLAGTVGEELVIKAINNAYLLYNDPAYAEMLQHALTRAQS